MSLRGKTTVALLHRAKAHVRQFPGALLTERVFHV